MASASDPEKPKFGMEGMQKCSASRKTLKKMLDIDTICPCCHEEDEIMEI